MNGNPVNISEINAILWEQLNRVLNCKAMVKNKSDTGMIQSTQESAEKAQCSNVSKAVYCEASDHWIHYKCDKLSEKEITDIENHKVSSYVCKNCSNETSKKRSVKFIFFNIDDFYQTFKNQTLLLKINLVLLF